MTFKRNPILDAAMDAAVRYGTKRMRMSDVAAMADVSRQTVYTAYKTKDDLMRAVIDYWIQELAYNIKLAWEKEDDLGARLDIYFAKAIIKPYSVMQTMPDARDMFLGVDPVTVDAIRHTQVVKHKLLAELFKDHEAQIKSHGQSLEQFAAFVQMSSKGLMGTAHDEAELKSLLLGLKASIMAVCKTS